MKISIITLFPEIFEPILNASILGRAQKKDLVEFELINLRDFGEGNSKTVDDKPYGGGAGMVLKATVLSEAIEYVVNRKSIIGKKVRQTINDKPYTILTSASGTPYKQSTARELSKLDHIIIICGHYEGIDQRFIDKYVDLEISIGDYVLTGGELPAMIIADSITRLIPGVLKKPEAVENESFSNYKIDASSYQLLEHPHYTRPEEFEDSKVPEVLTSGNHAEINKWRAEKSFEKTKKVRPDLLKD